MNSKRLTALSLTIVLSWTVVTLCLSSRAEADSVSVVGVDSANAILSDSSAIVGKTEAVDDNRSLAERTGAIAATPISELPTSTGSITAIVRMIGALCAVLALMWIAVLVAKRYLRGRSPLANGGKQMSVVETLWLGPKKQIVLLSVGSRQVVVGVTEGTMTTLSELTSDELTQPMVAAEKAVKSDTKLSQNANRPFEGLLVQAGGRLQQLLKQTNNIS